MKSPILLSTLGVVLLMQCGKKETTPPKPEESPVTQTGLSAKASFPMGAAVNITLLKDRAAYRSVMLTEYNSVTAENAMKFGALHPSETTYNWTDADYLVEYGRANRTRIHGHTLIWYNGLPAWVTNYRGEVIDWENLMKTHIQTVMTHFKGKLASWDVVNEAFNDDGTLRNSVWRQKLGDDYIARAFQYAHQADPDALLFYNDYGHEYSTTKRTAILALVNSLKTRGIPIHGIGLQMHTNINQSDANLQRAIQEAAATGLRVHISELDIGVNPNKNPSLTRTPQLLQTQKAKYKMVVQTFKAIPASQRFGITTWNVGDADTWLRGFCTCPEWPLPFDDDYLKKPAYDGIVEGLQ